MRERAYWRGEVRRWSRMVGGDQGEGRRRPRVVRRVCRRRAGLRVIVVVVFIFF
jgi:hypothetical protein